MYFKEQGKCQVYCPVQMMYYYYTSGPSYVLAVKHFAKLIIIRTKPIVCFIVMLFILGCYEKCTCSISLEFSKTKII